MSGLGVSNPAPVDLALPSANKPSGHEGGSWSFPSILPFSTGNRYIDSGLSVLTIALALGGLAYCTAMAVGGFRARRALQL